MQKFTVTALTFCLFVTSIMAVGCATKGQTGAALGGATGAAIGAQFGRAETRWLGGLIGLGAGTLIGYMIGNEMDKHDSQQISRTLETTPSGQTVAWQNPDTNVQYQMTPQPAVQSGDGLCRDFVLNGTDIAGRQEKLHAMACRNAYGDWVVQDRP